MLFDKVFLEARRRIFNSKHKNVPSGGGGVGRGLNVEVFREVVVNLFNVLSR